eukprot:scaffold78990_cov61-Phaeocystis_antarctica.AAC.2
MAVHMATGAAWSVGSRTHRAWARTLYTHTPCMECLLRTSTLHAWQLHLLDDRLRRRRRRRARRRRRRRDLRAPRLRRLEHPDVLLPEEHRRGWRQVHRGALPTTRSSGIAPAE